MDETNAFSALNQLTMQQSISPSKAPQFSADILSQFLRGFPTVPVQQIPQLPLQPTPTTNLSHQVPLHPIVVPTDPTGELVASPSAGSDASGSQQDDDVAMEVKMPLGPLVIDSPANITAGLGSSEPKSRADQWIECFTTTSRAEYEALVYSVYVNPTTEKKPDGWLYHDCLHRLQSKCRYKLRTKQQDEFFICEEKGCHNHGAVEPVGQAGSHAGLPKTIREIVDRSYNESWPVDARAAKIDEEVKRLGLPANPRLGRQIDNRIAYLRRVKNLNESRKMSDQVAGEHPNNHIQGLFDANILQTLMEQNGGSLVMEKGAVEQLIGSQAAAALAAAQQEIEQPQQMAPPMVQQQTPQPVGIQVPMFMGGAVPDEQENSVMQ